MIKPDWKQRLKNFPANSIIKYGSISVVSIATVLGAAQLYASNLSAEQNFPPTTIIDTQQIATTATPTPSPVPQEPKTTMPTVYIAPSGEKYHVAGCRHIRGSETVEMTIEEAVELGKEPCKDCIG